MTWLLSTLIDLRPKVALSLASPLFAVRKCSRRRNSALVPAVPCRQSGQQLLGGQNSVREARPVDLVRRVHAFRLKGSGRILNQGDVVAKLHAKASGTLDAGVGYHADEDDLLDPMLCELGVEVGIGEAALCPVLKHDDVASAGTELGMELSAPRSGGECVDLVPLNLGGVHMLPPLVVVFAPAVMRHDDDLDTRRPDRRNQLAHVVVETDRFGRLSGGLVELAAFTHEIVVGIDDQQSGAVDSVETRCHHCLQLQPSFAAFTGHFQAVCETNARCANPRPKEKFSPGPTETWTMRPSGEIPAPPPTR